MSSQHRDPALTVRPPADLKEAAQSALSARDIEIRAFVVACLKALVANPDQFLKVLTGHWPEKKPRGRPRRSSVATEGQGRTTS
ncbi:hypothetical protein [Streptomyces sp. 3N207]|uniref:hypothetical protein n=1 Tax=Streptomyces sp. 3N207 TaxID=3457417 RepID=UPI003FD58F33